MSWNYWLSTRLHGSHCIVSGVISSLVAVSSFMRGLSATKGIGWFSFGVASVDRVVFFRIVITGVYTFAVLLLSLTGLIWLGQFMGSHAKFFNFPFSAVFPSIYSDGSLVCF